MRKKEFSAVILSVLLAVSACGGGDSPSGGAVKGSEEGKRTEAVGVYKIGSKSEREAHPEIEGLGEGKELSFLSTKEAESQVKEVLSQIGFSEVKLLEICVLPVAWHRCQEEQEIAAGLLKEEEKLGDRWDAFGDCYVLTLTPCYDGIPLYENSYTLPDDSAVNGGRIRAILSKDGIQMLEVPNRYAAERTADAQKLLTREEILDKMSEKSAEIIRTAESR